MENSSPDRYFRTASFNLASFLFAKEFSLVNIDKANPKRALFVFVNSPELLDSVDTHKYAEQNASEALVDARAYAVATKKLKEMLYSEQ